MKKTLFYLVLWSCAIVSRGQSAFEGGLLISDDDHREPVATALLELNSSTRGVLLPRMTYENMRAIHSPADGLMVFVTSSIDHGVSARGFYFYDDVLRRDWVKIEGQVERKYQAEPVGTIVGFSGRLSHFFNADGTGMEGTEYAGWSICDGGNGTPDLTNRFLVGAASTSHYGSRIDDHMVNGLDKSKMDLDAVRARASNYDIVGRSSADQSTISLRPHHMPIHKHKPKQIDIIQVEHTHELPVLGHTHAYERATGRSNQEKYPQEAKNKGAEMSVPVESTSPDIDTDDNISLKYEQNMTLTIDFPQCHLEKYGSVNPTPVYNDPKYYVLAFVIKTASSPYVYQDALRNDIVFEIYDGSGAGDPYSMTYYQSETR